MVIAHDIICTEILWASFCDPCDRQSITASISSKNITQRLTRVKSSNLWSCMIDVKDYKEKTGDVYIQFKAKNGGPGDVYMYFDVPISLYKKMISAPSKGHAFWKYIRGKFTYAKLTGDKKTKQKGGINSPGAIPKTELQLAESDDVMDRIKAANTTDDINIFRMLENDPNEEVRKAVATNCQDIDILEDLVFDESPNVRRALMYVTDDYDILTVLADDKDISVRYELTKNCKDPRILKILTTDKNAKVRNSAKRQLDRLDK